MVFNINSCPSQTTVEMNTSTKKVFNFQVFFFIVKIQSSSDKAATTAASMLILVPASSN